METAKGKAQRRAEEDAWAVFFSCLRDKEGFGIKRMARVWDETIELTKEIVSGKVTFPKLSAEIKALAGLDLFDVVAYQDSGTVTAGDVRRAGNWSRRVTEMASWCLYLTALRRSEKYGPDRLRRVWGEILYLQDSLRRGRVTAEDLRAALADEAGFCFDGETPKK